MFTKLPSWRVLLCVSNNSFIVGDNDLEFLHYIGVFFMS